MAFVDENAKEINCKVVFFGPPMCGKSTSLRYINKQVNRGLRKDEGASISEDEERTLYFDFVPVDLGQIKDYKARVHLYTVPGQRAYEQARRIIAKGVDGIVFMADSDLPRMSDNAESLQELKRILEEEGAAWDELPKVFQYNKRDLKKAVPVEEMRRILNKDRDSEFETVAITGQGVMDVLTTIAEKVLLSLKS
jgi:signal recognition particle receptor subunit beta